jgi:hypothetical protein
LKKNWEGLSAGDSYLKFWLFGRLRLGGSQLKASPGETVCETPISKITRAKWTGGVAPTEPPALQAQSYEFSWMPVAHTYNPNYPGGRD